MSYKDWVTMYYCILVDSVDKDEDRERLLANAREDGLLKPFAYPDKVGGEL